MNESMQTQLSKSANEILHLLYNVDMDEMPPELELKPSEWAVLIFLLGKMGPGCNWRTPDGRQALGLSLAQLTQSMPFKERAVEKTVKALVDKGWIERVRVRHSYSVMLPSDQHKELLESIKRKPPSRTTGRDAEVHVTESVPYDSTEPSRTTGRDSRTTGRDIPYHRTDHRSSVEASGVAEQEAEENVSVMNDDEDDNPFDRSKPKSDVSDWDVPSLVHGETGPMRHPSLSNEENDTAIAQGEDPSLVADYMSDGLSFTEALEASSYDF